ncbi:MAG: carbohydrate-binding family 9-like protein [Ginsengibacter sp.]
MAIPILLLTQNHFAFPSQKFNFQFEQTDDSAKAGRYDMPDDSKMRDSETIITIKKTNDFQFSGDGSAENWRNTSWINIPKRTSSIPAYQTKVKLLYSETGIYVLFFCEDKKLTATMDKDFLDLWNEDVVEIFLQPDGGNPTYLEYEISPLNYELPIIIYNEKGKLNSWQPFHYENDRKTRHATTVQGGEKKSNGQVKSWTAEIFIPFNLMKPVLDKVPTSGTNWKGNIFRVDYDEEATEWSWQLTGSSFHEYEKFGSFHFE